MPLYVFKRRDNGEEVEEFFHHVSDPVMLTLPDGTVADRVRFPLSTHARLNPHGRGDQVLWGRWPILSDGLGCHPDQIPAMRRSAGCEFTPDGRAILRNPQHQKKVARRAGLEVY